MPARNKIEDFFLKGTSAYGSTFFYGSKFYKVGKTKLSLIQNVPSKKSRRKGNQLGQIQFWEELFSARLTETDSILEKYKLSTGLNMKQKNALSFTVNFFC